MPAKPRISNDTIRKALQMATRCHECGAKHRTGKEIARELKISMASVTRILSGELKLKHPPIRFKRAKKQSCPTCHATINQLPCVNCTGKQWTSSNR